MTPSSTHHAHLASLSLRELAHRVARDGGDIATLQPLLDQTQALSERAIAATLRMAGEAHVNLTALAPHVDAVFRTEDGDTVLVDRDGRQVSLARLEVQALRRSQGPFAPGEFLREEVAQPTPRAKRPVTERAAARLAAYLGCPPVWSEILATFERIEQLLVLQDALSCEHLSAPRRVLVSRLTTDLWHAVCQVHADSAIVYMSDALSVLVTVHGVTVPLPAFGTPQREIDGFAVRHGLPAAALGRAVRALAGMRYLPATAAAA